MSEEDVRRRMWEKVQQKTKRPVNPKELQNLSKGLNPNNFANPQVLDQLINNLSRVAGVNLTPEQKRQVAALVQNNKEALSSVQGIMQMMKKLKI
jgi:hypothetical protein